MAHLFFKFHSVSLFLDLIEVKYSNRIQDGIGTNGTTSEKKSLVYTLLALFSGKSYDF